MLGTSSGAAKAALHRGRGKLAEPALDDARVPVPAALDAFCRAFDAGDLTTLTALLLATVTVEMPGCAVDLGLAATTDPRSGILYHTVLSPLSVGMPARFLDGYDGARAHTQRVYHRGEQVVLLWYGHTTGEAVRCIIRIELQESLVSRLRVYYFSPELLVEVAGELGVPVRTNGRGLQAPSCSTAGQSCLAAAWVLPQQLPWRSWAALGRRRRERRVFDSSDGLIGAARGAACPLAIDGPAAAHYITTTL